MSPKELARCSLLFCAVAASGAAEDVGPAAALSFAEGYRGDLCRPGERYCYPHARGIPFADTKNIIQMDSALWRPKEISADFRRRMGSLAPSERKSGIVVILKTERCATKIARLCSVTTAAFEKEATPLVHRFAVYGLQLKPRDGDSPPGSLPIETGAEACKNEAAGIYRFVQGPGATIVVLNPVDGSEVAHSDAMKLRLFENDFISLGGRTPQLEKFLAEALQKLASLQKSENAVFGVSLLDKTSLVPVPVAQWGR